MQTQKRKSQLSGGHMRNDCSYQNERICQSKYTLLLRNISTGSVHVCKWNGPGIPCWTWDRLTQHRSCLCCAVESTSPLSSPSTCKMPAIKLLFEKDACCTFITETRQGVCTVIVWMAMWHWDPGPLQRQSQVVHGTVPSMRINGIQIRCAQKEWANPTLEEVGWLTRRKGRFDPGEVRRRTVFITSNWFIKEDPSNDLQNSRRYAVQLLSQRYPLSCSRNAFVFGASLPWKQQLKQQEKLSRQMEDDSSLNYCSKKIKALFNEVIPHNKMTEK